MEKDKKVVRKAISMYRSEWAEVARVEERYGLNTSAAMRLIVNEYSRGAGPTELHRPHVDLIRRVQKRQNMNASEALRWILDDYKALLQTKQDDYRALLQTREVKVDER